MCSGGRHRARRTFLKNVTIDRENAASKEVTVEELKPQPDPPVAHHTRKIVLTIGGKRYELMHHTEVREITKGPAKLIEMPRRSAINR
jgi:hypothetical protein